jgi:hypothetical protein
MLLGASIYYVARRALHAACCPSYPASCLVHVCSEIPASSGGLPLPLDRRLMGLVGRRGMPMHRASGCCSRAVAAARTAPRLGMGTRRHSATSAASGAGAAEAFRAAVSRSLTTAALYPAAARYPAASRHPTAARHLTAVRYPAATWYPLGWVRSELPHPRPNIRRRTRQHSTGNGRGRERAMRADGCPCSASGCNDRMSTETTIW